MKFTGAPLIHIHLPPSCPSRFQFLSTIYTAEPLYPMFVTQPTWPKVLMLVCTHWLPFKYQYLYPLEYCMTITDDVSGELPTIHPLGLALSLQECASPKLGI